MKFVVRKEKKRNNNIYMGNPYIKMIEEKLNDELNKYCVECGNENPEYISINNGIFICFDCAQNHLKFPKNISYIIQNNINNLRLNEIQPLLCGGNKALLDFINNEYPKLSELPPHILYRTRAMSFYRQQLQYLIKGGIQPVKPSIKNAYKISSFNNNYNNMLNSYDKFYNNNTEERNLLNNINYNKFYQTINFGGVKNYNRNNLNEFDIRLANTISNREKNNDNYNYIVNKPRQINFQNNNNIIIGNLDSSKRNGLIYSPQKIKIDFKPKKQGDYLNNNINSIPYNLNHINKIYVKPKLVLSPKNKDNYIPNEKEKILNLRTNSVDIIKKNKNIQNNSVLFERGEIATFQTTNTINENESKTSNNWNSRKMNRNLSQNYYIHSQNPINYYIRKSKYIHKSLSQRTIKNNEDFNNKFLITGKTETDIFSPSRNPLPDNFINNNTCLSDNYKYEIQTIPTKNTLNTIFNRNKNNKIIENFSRYNDRSSTQETINFSEVESLPIKINLKLNKKTDNLLKYNTKVLAKENIFYSANESKNDINKNEKDKYNIPIKFSPNKNIKVNQKEKKIEEVKINKLNLKKKINKMPFGLNKNRSQENLLMNNHKMNIENKNKENYQGKIRNKYKLNKK